MALCYMLTESLWFNWYCLAMNATTPKENRKKIALLIPATLTAIVVGITEPLEFTFYLLHLIIRFTCTLKNDGYVNAWFRISR